MSVSRIGHIKQQSATKTSQSFHRGRAKQDLPALQEAIPLTRVHAHSYAHSHRRTSIRLRPLQQGFQREVQLTAALAYVARPDHKPGQRGGRLGRRGGPLRREARILRARRGGGAARPGAEHPLQCGHGRRQPPREPAPRRRRAQQHAHAAQTELLSVLKAARRAVLG